MSNELTTTQVYDLVGLDGIEDFSGISTIDSSGLIASQPRNTLSMKGKLFTFIHADGTTADGGTSIDCVILKVSPYQNKVYFTGPQTDPNSVLACSSANGKAPDAWITEPQASNCELCPRNQTGSGNGGQGKACRDSKAIAILPSQFPNTPFLVNLPVTSIISFRNFVTGLTKQLRAAGKLKDPKAIAPLELFVTRISFKQRDEKGQSLSYPVLEFNYVGTHPRDHWDSILQLANSEEVKKLVRIDAESIAAHQLPLQASQALAAQVSQVAPATVATAAPAPQAAPAPVFGQAPSVAQVKPASPVSPAAAFGAKQAVVPPATAAAQDEAASIIDSYLAEAVDDFIV